MSLFSIKFTVYFVFNAYLIYLAGVFMTKEDRNKKLFLKLSLVWLLGNLCIFKYTHILLDSVLKLGLQFPEISETTFTKIALPLGMSYIVFRLIHYIVEVYRKTLPEHTFWDLALYVFFFPTFIAGPVERFQNFQPQTVKAKPLDTEDINYGLFRIISGIIKKFIVADSLTPIIIPLLNSPEDYSRILVLLAVYGLAIQVYMDFSGYTDMALGVARLFGYKIIENFNYPFFKKNIAMFWRNWHMSVYSFIRDYFFFPFFVYRASQLKIYIGMVTTFVVFMLWHEFSIPFLIAGIYHGLGLAAWQFLQGIKQKHKPVRKIFDNKVSDPVCTFLTFNFVSFSIIVFYFDMSTITDIWLKVFS
jgi:D-alanyl-lipoteichoic acid acyltransferase DltB (MBOAT superfamily)